MNEVVEAHGTGKSNGDKSDSGGQTHDRDTRDPDVDSGNTGTNNQNVKSDSS